MKWTQTSNRSRAHASQMENCAFSHSRENQLHSFGCVICMFACKLMRAIFNCKIVILDWALPMAWIRHVEVLSNDFRLLRFLSIACSATNWRIHFFCIILRQRANVTLQPIDANGIIHACRTLATNTKASRRRIPSLLLFFLHFMFSRSQYMQATNATAHVARSSQLIA